MKQTTIRQINPNDVRYEAGQYIFLGLPHKLYDKGRVYNPVRNVDNNKVYGVYKGLAVVKVGKLHDGKQRGIWEYV